MSAILSECEDKDTQFFGKTNEKGGLFAKKEDERAFFGELKLGSRHYENHGLGEGYVFHCGETSCFIVGKHIVSS